MRVTCKIGRYLNKTQHNETRNFGVIRWIHCISFRPAQKVRNGVKYTEVCFSRMFYNRLYHIAIYFTFCEFIPFSFPFVTRACWNQLQRINPMVYNDLLDSMKRSMALAFEPDTKKCILTLHHIAYQLCLLSWHKYVQCCSIDLSQTLARYVSGCLLKMKPVSRNKFYY